MASQHPLDIFRSSNSGFESASRRRRTIAGRVITSRAREADDGASVDESQAAIDDQSGHGSVDAGSAADAVEPAEERQRADAPPAGERQVDGTAADAASPAAESAGQGHGKGRRRKRQKGRKGPAGQQAVLPGVVAEALAPEVPEDADAEPAPEPVAQVTQVEPQQPAPPAEPGRPTRITGAAARPGRLTPAPLGARAQAPVEAGDEPGSVRPVLPVRRRARPALPMALLAGSCVVVLALVTWIVVHNLGDDGGDLTVLNAAQALDRGAPAAELPIYCIQVASYSSTEKGQRLAWEAHDELEGRGYTEVDVIGQQVPDAEGVLRLATCSLVVGRANDKAELEDLRTRLTAVGDWPFGDRRPFLDARIVEHPSP